jgi:MtN3 and saliva related transmembrane protein
MDILTPHNIGMMAAILSTLNQFPQAYKVLRTGDTRSISLYMYCIVEAAIVLWLAYGIMINDIPLMVSNTLSLIPITYIFVMKAGNAITGKDRKKSEEEN